MKDFIRKLIPAPIFRALQPAYHFMLALTGALVYRFPARKIKIVGITGTKGKTSTTEFVNVILEEAGFKTALASTLRFKIDTKSSPNMHKMTMPGRFFMQKFLRHAVDSGCGWAVVEMTSEGAKQSRHKFVHLDALIFTNISPEHIESHGSFEKYLEAKLSIGHALEKSPKAEKIIVANKDDPHGRDFLELHVGNKYPFSLLNVKPYGAHETGTEFRFEGELISSSLKGLFNIENMLAAATFGSALGIPPITIKKALEKIKSIRGRVEFVRLDPQPTTHNRQQLIQNFDVVVDYAHTPDSLEKLYQAFPRQRKICILGNTGGGRDTWKRAEMGKIADHYCDEIILTNEDPYDEDPMSIVEDMRSGISEKPCETIIDRREALRFALKRAHELTQSKQEKKDSVAVLITGKGTDPYIMGPNGTKQRWDDAETVRQELKKLLKQE
jgi:UDP-N-acetylmuramoyl-L-alanyl-D-glutamate--2,6-diaminopimelate ligase